VRWRWKGCAPNINAGLHPTLPICQRLNDEFVLVVGREVSAVMLQPVHDEVAFLSREESSSSRVLFSQPKMSKKTEHRERWERSEEHTSCIVKCAIPATATVTRPSSKNCSPKPQSRLETRQEEGLTIHAHSCNPAMPSIFSIPNASRPPNAPAIVAAEKKMATRLDFSLRLYHKEI